MSIEVIRTVGLQRIVEHVANSFEAAKAWADAQYAIVHLEDDREYADCADAITLSGDIISIQPEGFRL